jgi:hypothetical protein
VSGAGNVFVRTPIGYDEHEVPNLFFDLLKEREVKIRLLPLDTYDLDGDGEEVLDGEGEGEGELEEIEEEVFDASQLLKKKGVVNYTEIKTLAWCGHGRKCPSMRFREMTKPGSAIGKGLKINSSRSCLELPHPVAPVDRYKAGGM